MNNLLWQPLFCLLCYSTSVQGVRVIQLLFKVCVWNFTKQRGVLSKKHPLIHPTPPTMYQLYAWNIIIEIPCCTCASDWTSALTPLRRSCKKAVSWIFINVSSSGKRFHFVWKAIRKCCLWACCCSSCEQRHRPYPSKGTRRDRMRKKYYLIRRPSKYLQENLHCRNWQGSVAVAVASFQTCTLNLIMTHGAGRTTLDQKMNKIIEMIWDVRRHQPVCYRVCVRSSARTNATTNEVKTPIMSALARLWWQSYDPYYVSW